MEVEMFFDDGVWYRGRIVSLSHGVATVFFDDGDVQQVSLPHPDVRPAPPPPPVRLQTRDGRSLRSRAVLLCVPMGVMQQGAIKFEPSLPSWKHDAIRRAGNGLINKLTVEYREVFWDPQVDFFGTTSSRAEDRGAFFLVWSLVRFTGRPILIAVLSGEAARKYESMSDELVVKKFQEAMSSIFGQLPQPERSHVTRWGSNPHARGAYSFVKVGSMGGPDYDLLAEPVGGQVFFAGEGTCREHPATAAGAYLTGLREAARLHRLLSEMQAQRRKDLKEEVEEKQASFTDMEEGN
uniref:Amine oxidase domain-containing protein n=1 Tax=Hanusia phi TaxID=3032 RepID=A0A7S0HVU7_9CRYP